MMLFTYLLNFSLSILVLLAFYKLFLEGETLHLVKRYYLLLSVVVSLIIPCITFTSYVEQSIPISSHAIYAEVEEIQSVGINTKQTRIPWEIFGWSIYSIGFLILGFRFIRNLIAMVYSIRSNSISKKGVFKMVLLKEDIIPYTFCRHIFCNREKYVNGKIPREILWHEETHARELHSVDLLFIELIQIVFWFHPLIYIVKSAIRLNHEFLADRSVLDKGVIRTHYQNILLACSSSTSYLRLTHYFNHSFIKKRLIIMKKQSKQEVKLIKVAFIVPLILFTLFSFSGRSIEFIEGDQETHQESAEKSETQESYQDAEERYNKLARHYNAYPKTDFVKKAKDMWEIRELYESIPVEKRAGLEPYPRSTTSLSFFIDIDGNYLLDDEEIALDEIDEIFKQLTKKERSNAYVFDDKNDIGRYVAQRGALNRSSFPPNDIYIHVYSGEELDKKGIEKDFLKSSGAKIVFHAASNDKLKTYTAKLNDLFRSHDLKVDY